jgi:hypothetical protein
MMFVFFWACFVQGITWMPLSAVPQATSIVFPAMTEELIFWSLNIAPIIYVPVSGFASYLLTTTCGMQRTLRASVFFSLLCATIRIPCVLAPLPFRSSGICSAILLLSGAFCGIAAPFTQGSPSRFSAIWFPPNERTRATAFGFLGTYLGTAVSYILSPMLVPDPNVSAHHHLHHHNATLGSTNEYHSRLDQIGEMVMTAADMSGLSVGAFEVAGVQVNTKTLDAVSAITQDSELQYVRGLTRLLMCEAAFSILTVICVYLYFPDGPNQIAHSQSTDAPEDNENEQSPLRAREGSATRLSPDQATRLALPAPLMISAPAPAKISVGESTSMGKSVSTSTKGRAVGGSGDKGGQAGGIIAADSTQGTSSSTALCTAYGSSRVGAITSSTGGGTAATAGPSPLPLASKVTFVQQLWQVLAHQSFMLFAIACGLLQGFYSSWAASLSLVLGPLGFTAQQAGMCGFVGTMSYVVGSYGIGEIADRYYKRRFRRLLLILLLLVFPCFILYAISTPLPAALLGRSLGKASAGGGGDGDGGDGDGGDGDGGDGGAGKESASSADGVILMHCPRFVTVGAVGFAGLFLGSTAPIFIEVSAELTHPIEEGFSANIVGLLINATNVLALGIFPYIPKTMVNVVVLGAFVLATALVLIAPWRDGGTKSYPRLDAQLQRRTGGRLSGLTPRERAKEETRIRTVKIGVVA